jgi:cell division protein FtsQ
MKFVLKILMILILGSYLVVVLGFADRQYEEVICSGLEIVVKDSLERGLVSRDDVKNLVYLEHPKIAGVSISAIDMAGIEEDLNAFPAISDAQVYTNVAGRLMVELSQRRPVVRIEDRDHRDYYLDPEGFIIPATMDYTPHILFANGNIPGTYRKEAKIPDADEMMQDLLKLSNYIQDHPFWSSQIVQVYVRRNGEFELIPRVGSQIILLGTADRMEYKFFKLETLYREGFSKTGWNQYEIINLKYNNQVICTKR